MARVALAKWDDDEIPHLDKIQLALEAAREGIALLKNDAFATTGTLRLDERAYAHVLFKALPLWESDVVVPYTDDRGCHHRHRTP